MCFPPAVSCLVVPIVSRRFPIVFPGLVVTSLFLLLRLPSLPVSCPATTRSIALAFPSCSSPWFPAYPDPFPVASLAFPNSDRVSLEHIQKPYLHPDLQATLWLWSAIGLFNRLGFFSFNIIGLSSPLLPCRLVDLRRGLLYSENLQHLPSLSSHSTAPYSDCTSAPNSPFNHLERSSRPTSLSMSLLLCD